MRVACVHSFNRIKKSVCVETAAWPILPANGSDEGQCRSLSALPRLMCKFRAVVISQRDTVSSVSASAALQRRRPFRSNLFIWCFVGRRALLAEIHFWQTIADRAQGRVGGGIALSCWVCPCKAGTVYTCVLSGREWTQNRDHRNRLESRMGQENKAVWYTNMNWVHTCPLTRHVIRCEMNAGMMCVHTV